LEKGVTLLAGIEAISDPDKRGKRTVMCLLNGQMRQVRVRDLSIASEVAAAEKADPRDKRHVAAPFSGAVTPTVEVGMEVSVGDQVATIEAMKMEAAINSPVAGVVVRVVLTGATPVEGGDLVLVIE
jgi:pyruvate carboxylase